MRVKLVQAGFDQHLTAWSIHFLNKLHEAEELG